MPIIQNTSVSFGKILKKLRKKANLTQEELAYKVGFARSYIALLERGYRNIETMSIRTLSRLAKGLGVDDAELLQASGQSIKSESSGTPFIFTQNRDAKDITAEEKRQADKATKGFLQYVDGLIKDRRGLKQNVEQSK